MVTILAAILDFFWKLKGYSSTPSWCLIRTIISKKKCNKMISPKFWGVKAQNPIWPPDYRQWQEPTKCCKQHAAGWTLVKYLLYKLVTLNVSWNVFTIWLIIFLGNVFYVPEINENPNVYIGDLTFEIPVRAVRHVIRTRGRKASQTIK